MMAVHKKQATKKKQKKKNTPKPFLLSFKLVQDYHIINSFPSRSIFVPTLLVFVFKLEFWNLALSRFMVLYLY